MKQLLENWKRFLKEEQQGEGMLLYHATCSPPEAFAKGIDHRKAKGFGQGEGFYFWTSLERAQSHAKNHILAGGQKEAPCPDDPPIGYIIVSDEPVTPENFDIDYEIYACGFAEFMIDNLEYFADNMNEFDMTSRFPKRKPERAREYLIKPPHMFTYAGEKPPTIKLLYMKQDCSRVSGTAEAARLSKIAGKLAEINPEMFKQFEEQILSKASAIKYNGEKTIYPLRIEDLEGNVVWSRK